MTRSVAAWPSSGVLEESWAAATMESPAPFNMSSTPISMPTRLRRESIP